MSGSDIVLYLPNNHACKRARRFARLRADATQARRRILSAPFDTDVSLDASDLEGANVWLLNYMASQGNFKVNYSVFRVPSELWNKARCVLASPRSSPNHVGAASMRLTRG